MPQLFANPAMKLAHVVLAAVLWVACKDKPEESTSTSAKAALPGPSSSQAPAAPSAAPPAQGAYSGDPNDLNGLFAKLTSERDDRPKADPTVEKVFDTITTKLNIALDDRKQVAGFTIGARYCFKGVTKTDIHVVACEYTDAPTAVKGVATASITNKYLKHREVLQRRATTLSVHQTAETDASVADAKKIKDAFVAL